MPENNDNNGGAGGDGAAAKAAADKAAADAVAAAGGNKGGGDGEETVTIKKSDLKKIEDDRDNYKKIGLQKKADERNLGGGEGGGAGGSATIDEKKVGEVATAATNKALRAASEKTAKRAFLVAHPEYVDDAQWTAFISHYRETDEGPAEDLEKALLLHKRSTGKLDEYLRSEHERGVREGRIQGEFGSGHGTGGAGDKNEGGKGSGKISPEGERMARALHNDPAKVAKVDPSKDNVINVL